MNIHFIRSLFVSESFSAKRAAKVAKRASKVAKRASRRRPTKSDLMKWMFIYWSGTYTVTILKPGYKPWTAAGVTVTKDVCHVRGVALTAMLQQM